MRKLFVIFLLIINFLSGFAYGQGANPETNSFNHNPQIIGINYQSNNIISVDFKGYENAILKLNQNQEEISALLSQNNNKINNPEQISYKNHIKISFCQNRTQKLFIKFHNISSVLKNEICSRAP